MICLRISVRLHQTLTLLNHVNHSSRDHHTYLFFMSATDRSCFCAESNQQGSKTFSRRYLPSQACAVGLGEFMDLYATGPTKFAAGREAQAMSEALYFTLLCHLIPFLLFAAAIACGKRHPPWPTLCSYATCATYLVDHHFTCKHLHRFLHVVTLHTGARKKGFPAITSGLRCLFSTSRQ